MPRNNNITEEGFLASLKRIERQYESKIFTSGKQSIHLQPPNEAAFALGKGLGRSFVVLSSAGKSNKVQEELFAVLANRDVNPSVCQGFFDEILSAVTRSRNSDSGNLYLEVFFPPCILFTDQAEVTRRQQQDHFDDLEHEYCGFDPLTCMIRSYAQYTRFSYQMCMDASFDQTLSSESVTSSVGIIAKTYSKLQTQAGRMAMVRDFTNAAFVLEASGDLKKSHPEPVIYRDMLTPLVTCSVLAPHTVIGWKDEYNLLVMESVLCMEGIWRKTYDFVEQVSIIEENIDAYSSLLAMVEWLTKMLNLFLLSIPTQNKQFRVARKELAHRWLCMVLDIGVFLLEGADGDTKKEQRNSKWVPVWFEGIVSNTMFRWFAAVPSYRVDMGAFWDPLQRIMYMYRSQHTLPLDCVLKLASMTMSHPIKDDIREILGLITIAIDNSNGIHPIASSIFKGLGSVFSRDPLYTETYKEFMFVLMRRKVLENRTEPSRRSMLLVTLTDLLEEGESIDEIMSYFSSCEDPLFDPNHRLSSIQQVTSLLLFGIGFMVEKGKHREGAFFFVEKLLFAYPYLSVSVLPVVIDSINTAAIEGDGDSMMVQLEFLAKVLVRDPQCASQIWNLLGKELMGDNLSANVRSSIIRLFPMICHANKRLYKRIISSMGNMLANMNSMNGGEERNSEIRLAIAATTADLARDGYVRDPTDVISWLQDFISDTGWVRSISTIHREKDENRKATVAHYSILALHHLVKAGELDFKLVLVVLKKKLCDVHSVEEVSRLPHIVLESLILLLSDGESDEDDSSVDDEDDNRLIPIGVSIQTSRSVETLISLWNHHCLRQEHVSDVVTKTTILRCKANILRSLTEYSFDAIGIDEEGLLAALAIAANEADEKPRSLTPSCHRYNELKSIVEDGIRVLNQLQTQDSSIVKSILDVYSIALSDFVSNIIKFEEDTLGSSIWQKRQNTGSSEGRKTTKKRKGKVNLREILNQLPSPESVTESYNESRSHAASLSALLCFDGKSTDVLTDCAMDATSSSSDAIFQAFYVQAWLNSARNALCHVVSTEAITSSLEKLLNDVEEFRFDSPDSFYIFLSAISVLIPNMLGPHGDYTSYMQKISDDVWEAYNSHLFEDSDTAKLCLGFVGICDIWLGSSQRLFTIVNALEKSVTGYGGLPSFGTYYALSVIAQTYVSREEELVTKHGEAPLELPTRILSFLLKELSKCIEGSEAVVAILETSFKTMSVEPEDSLVLEALKPNSFKVAKPKKRAAESIFVALGISLPIVAKLNEALIYPVLCFLESIEWGSGIGSCLRSILIAWSESATFNKDVATKKYKRFSTSLQETSGLEKNGRRDLLLSMMAIRNESESKTLKLVESFLQIDNTALSCILGVFSIATIPCFGHGKNSVFTDAPALANGTSATDVSTVLNILNGNVSDVQKVLRGLLASLTFNNESIAAETSNAHQKKQLSGSKLPEALLGTAFEILMSCFHACLEEQNKAGVAILLKCLEISALPDQFAGVVEYLATNEEPLKTACIELLVSQSTGRPRAVFDGRDFVKLALKISKMPIESLRDIIGQKQAADIFILSFGKLVTRFPSQEVEVAIENVFRYCINQSDDEYLLVISFLKSIESLLREAEDDKSPRFSPKCMNSIYSFLEGKAFSLIQDVTSAMSSTIAPSHVMNIIRSYAACVALVPGDILNENKMTNSDNRSIYFPERCLYIHTLMILIGTERCSLSSDCYQHIAASIAWLSQELIQCFDDISAPRILQVACAVAEASMGESDDRKEELLVSFLDNLLMVDSNASLMGLQILSLLVFQWRYGRGGLSLVPVLGISVGRWRDLPVGLLNDISKLALRDLPCNLSQFTRSRNLSGVAFNRLWRIYTKWLNQQANEATLLPLRMSLYCCSDVDTMTNAEDMTLLVKSFDRGISE